MYTFKDYYQNEVILSFSKEPFMKNPKHVWVICSYKGKWLLTHHKERGYEFPGGKVEENEITSDGAIREVLEETGGLVSNLHYIAQYKVKGKSATIVKNVYYAEIEKLVKQHTYYETDGPNLFGSLPKNIKERNDFSFIMKDEVLTYCLQKVKENFIK